MSKGEKNDIEKIFEEIISKSFQNLMKHTFRDSRSSLNAKKYKYKPTHILRHIISALLKIKDKGKIPKAAQKTKQKQQAHNIQEKKNKNYTDFS